MSKDGLSIFLDKRIKDIKHYLEVNERSEDEDGFTPSEELQICYLAKRMLALDNANPSEALECLEEMCKDKAIHDYILYNCLDEDFLNIRNSLLKAQEQENLIVELCEYYGMDNLYPYDNLKEIETSFKNSLDNCECARMELLGKLNKQEKMLRVILEKDVNLTDIKVLNNYEDYKVRIGCAYAYGKADIEWNNKTRLDDLKLLTQEEFDLIKEWLENETTRIKN